jgi:hypothetical protein
MENPTYSSSESTCTSMRPLEDGTFHVQSSWIWNLELWTLSAQDHSDNYSDPTTSFLDSRVSV